MKTIFLLILLSLLPYAKEITIAVAANVSYAIKPLVDAFETIHKETKVHVVLGSSGKLTAQIEHGAPYALFMSANMMYPQKLYKEHIDLQKPVVYAQGALALLSTKRYNLSQGIALLKEDSISKIAIANPQTAPYGMASLEALKEAKLYEAIKSKLVYGESISQTLIYATKVADIGIVAKSSLYATSMQAYKQNTHWVDIDTSLYHPIEQGMVLLDDTVEVKDFYDFILGTKAKEILQSFGYQVP